MYYGVLATSEEGGRQILMDKESFSADDIYEMIHKEPPIDAEGLPIYIFAVWVSWARWAVSGDGDDTSKLLSAYFTIPNVHDLPYELINGK
jgi:hypothetical protein